MSLHPGELAIKKFHYQQKKTTHYYFVLLAGLKINLLVKKP